MYSSHMMLFAVYIAFGTNMVHLVANQQYWGNTPCLPGHVPWDVLSAFNTYMCKTVIDQIVGNLYNS